jgi:hypothetical protein
MREPKNAEELFAPPCEECVQANRTMILTAVFGGMAIGALAAWVVCKR